MSYPGIIINGLVVLDGDTKIPEGTRVTVTIGTEQDPGETLQEVLMKYAGCMSGLPIDMAEQHDHYLHGIPKR